MAQKNVLKYILLGLLAHEEFAGYDIKKLFEGELRDFWYSNHSQIYPELRRMEEDALVTSDTKMVGAKLEKKFYRITERGRDALRAWMAEPLGAVPPSRDEFTLKLYLISDADDPLIPTLFREEIARREKNLRYLKNRRNEVFPTAESHTHHYGHALIFSQAIHREQQRLSWLRAEYQNIMSRSSAQEDASPDASL